VIEDHSKETGLYNSLCQIKNDLNIKSSNLFSIAPPLVYQDFVGDKAFYDKVYGLDSASIKSFLDSI
jgi:hypothetical protein